MTVSIVWAREQFHGPRPWIFLAGPTPRELVTPSWRPDAVRRFVAQDFGGTLLIPEDGTGEPFDEARLMDLQIDWEWEGLERSDAVLFWVPRDMDTLPGLTTNTEFGWMASTCPEKTVLGFPEGSPKNHYLWRLAGKFGVARCHDLDLTIERAIHAARSFVYGVGGS